MLELYGDHLFDRREFRPAALGAFDSLATWDTSHGSSFSIRAGLPSQKGDGGV
jgi:hypothetical protein